MMKIWSWEHLHEEVVHQYSLLGALSHLIISTFTAKTFLIRLIWSNNHSLIDSADNVDIVALLLGFCVGSDKKPKQSSASEIFFGHFLPRPKHVVFVCQSAHCVVESVFISSSGLCLPRESTYWCVSTVCIISRFCLRGWIRVAFITPVLRPSLPLGCWMTSARSSFSTLDPHLNSPSRLGLVSLFFF